MAGDILLYRADLVPIGDDQRQHLELARDIAERFNSRFGETFVVPEGIYPEIGARIMDLQDPSGRWARRARARRATIRMLDDPDVIRKKFKTRGHRLGREVRRARRKARRDEPDRHLLGRRRRDAGGDREPLRRLRLRAVQGRRRRGGGRLARPDPGALRALRSDEAELRRMLAVGAEKARAESAPLLEQMYERMGFVRP